MRKKKLLYIIKNKIKKTTMGQYETLRNKNKVKSVSVVLDGFRSCGERRGKVSEID